MIVSSPDGTIRSSFSRLYVYSRMIKGHRTVCYRLRTIYIIENARSKKEHRSYLIHGIPIPKSTTVSLISFERA